MYGNDYITGRRHGGTVICQMRFMCEGSLLFCFFFFFVFFAGRMEDFDLGLTNILTQITDEDIQHDGGHGGCEQGISGDRRKAAEFEWKGKAVCLL